MLSVVLGIDVCRLVVFYMHNLRLSICSEDSFTPTIFFSSAPPWSEWMNVLFSFTEICLKVNGIISVVVLRNTFTHISRWLFFSCAICPVSFLCRSTKPPRSMEFYLAFVSIYVYYAELNHPFLRILSNRRVIASSCMCVCVLLSLVISFLAWMFLSQPFYMNIRVCV